VIPRAGSPAKQPTFPPAVFFFVTASGVSFRDFRCRPDIARLPASLVLPEPGPEPEGSARANEQRSLPTRSTGHPIHRETVLNCVRKTWGNHSPFCKITLGSMGNIMRRYYLHIASKLMVYADDHGVVLSDLAAAHRCAVSVISNCIRGDTEKQDWRGWHIEIADDTCRPLLIVLFPTARRTQPEQRLEVIPLGL
jgi:hypothetical protein